MHDKCYNNEWKAFLLPTWNWRTWCPHFDWTCQPSTWWRWRKCEAMHYFKDTKSRRESCSCLLIIVVQQPEISSPPSQLKHSSTGVLWICMAIAPAPCHAPALMSPPMVVPLCIPLQQISPQKVFKFQVGNREPSFYLCPRSSEKSLIVVLLLHVLFL